MAKAAIISAMVVVLGSPNATVGRNAPPSFELLAVSGAITPSTAP